MKRLMFAVCAAALTACSNASLPSVTAPSVLGPSASAVGGGVASVRMLDPMQPSCPSQPPTGLVVMTNGTGVEARWDGVANADDYVLEITQRMASNNYRMVDGFPIAEDGVKRDFVLREDGRYQARVRTRACGSYGDWSPVFEFSTGVGQTPDAPVEFCENIEAKGCFLD